MFDLETPKVVKFSLKNTVIKMFVKFFSGDFEGTLKIKYHFFALSLIHIL